MQRLVAKTMCVRVHLSMSCARGEQGVRTPPPPGKLQVLKVYIGISNWTPTPWKKSDPLEIWTALTPGILKNYS